jgi:hypothetical protein
MRWAKNGRKNVAALHRSSRPESNLSASKHERSTILHTRCENARVDTQSLVVPSLPVAHSGFSGEFTHRIEAGLLARPWIAARAETSTLPVRRNGPRSTPGIHIGEF